MNLLAPLFLIGAAAVALPVIFHLIRRTSKDRLPFSTLMFLSPTPPRVTKKSRLEHIFLLLLRCLVLCLLALGFARPFFNKPVNSGMNSLGSKRTVVLVDASASMRRGDLWSEALDRAEAVLRKAQPGDQFAVFAFDRAVRRVVTFEEWNRMDIGDRPALSRSRLATVGPTWNATDLGSALVAALESFEDGDKKEIQQGPRQIVLISDMQEGSHLDGLQAYEWPEKVALSLETLKPRRTSNAGLQLVFDFHEMTADTEEGARVRVSNATDSKREQFKVQWDGVAGLKPVEVYVPPGQSRVVRLPLPPAGTPAEHVILSGDEEDFDNRIHYLAPKAERFSVLYLGNDAETDANQPLYFLKRAFQQTRRQDVQVSARKADAPLSGTDLFGTKFIVVSDPVGNPQPLRDFVQAGGSILFAVKSPAVAATIATVAGAASLPAEEATVRQYSLLGEVNFQHPLFAPFADPRFGDFTKIHFWKHRRMATNGLPNARVLARFDDGDPALMELLVGKGRLLVLSSGWHPADSQLALSSKFVPLLYSMLELGGGLSAPVTQFTVGDPVETPSSTAARITIRKPDGKDVELAAGEKFTQADQPGVYAITSAQPAVRFAVNLAPEESRTAAMSVDELERYGVTLKASVEKIARQAEQQRRLQNTELENQQKLWRWLVIAALAVLLFESWLAGHLSRRAPAEAAAA